MPTGAKDNGPLAIRLSVFQALPRKKKITKREKKKTRKGKLYKKKGWEGGPRRTRKFFLWGGFFYRWGREKGGETERDQKKKAEQLRCASQRLVGLGAKTEKGKGGGGGVGGEIEGPMERKKRGTDFPLLPGSERQ